MPFARPVGEAPGVAAETTGHSNSPRPARIINSSLKGKIYIRRIGSHNRKMTIMAPFGTAAFGSRVRLSSRTAHRCRAAVLTIFGLLVLAGSAIPTATRGAEPVEGEANLSTSDGYGRLVIKLASDVDTEVSTAGSILVIRFKDPVAVPVEQLPRQAPDYIGSARGDPDGSAIRLSLSRKVTVNTMTAGERLFVDLLPDGWRGPPPGLPAEVIRELSERARAAERALRQQGALAEAKKRPTIRVRALVQPTFVRFVIETPDGVDVSSMLNDQKLMLTFNAPLNFDLADAKLSAPANVSSIDQKITGQATALEMALVGDVDVHSFREDKNYIIDVAFEPSQKPASAATDAPRAAVAAAPSPESTAPARSVSPESRIAPLTSETFAQQAGIDIRQPNEPAVLPDAPQPPGPNATAAAKAEAPKVEAVSKPETSKSASSKSETSKPAAATEAKPADPATVEAVRDSNGLRLNFLFPVNAPAAMFMRADSVWLVFDSTQPIDVDPIRRNGGALISEVRRLPLDKGQAISIRLNRPQMPSLSGDQQGDSTQWSVLIADTMQGSTQALSAIRNIAEPKSANLIIPLAGAGRQHRLLDPDAGDVILVTTAALPVRGFVRRQDFVELSVLESIHGVVIRPGADDLTAETSADKIMIGRPGGLTLSPADGRAERASTAVQPLFAASEWRTNQSVDFVARQDELVTAIASTDPRQRTRARLDLARFYMSRGMYPEAKGVTDLVLADSAGGLADPAAVMVHAIAAILSGRPGLGLKDLADPAMSSNYDPQLWKAVALAKQEKWAEAREKFLNSEIAIVGLPTELQCLVLVEAMRTALEARDYSTAGKRSNDLDTIGVPAELAPGVAVLRGRLSEALGHDQDALAQYQIAAASVNRRAATEAKLNSIALRSKRNELRDADALGELETLALTWRGDKLEVRTLSMLARIYADAGRYREAFDANRTATRLQPNSELARQGQDDSSALFSQIFLSAKGDDLPPVEALGMFYEFRELAPIGRRGDEMIRRLAERLVSVDLLDQASELLQYQIDKRLEGAARAQVAARLAMVYLTNHKPERAIAALRSTRIADLSGELRQQRLLLEGRAQSDIGRHDLALDIISNLVGREAIRLRSDIYWAARRWREASEQIELYYGDRWRDFKPLNAAETGDVIRAAIGYSLAGDGIGLSRFREKYAPLMGAEPDKSAFDAASDLTSGNSGDMGRIAKLAASIDTLDGFLREMKTRFPDAAGKPLPAESSRADPSSTGSLPQIIGFKPVTAR